LLSETLTLLFWLTLRLSLLVVWLIVLVSLFVLLVFTVLLTV
jgi:hypothetical protein